MSINHTLCIYSNNSPGMLHRITVLFTRRKMNIESLTVSETETHGISRFTIVVKSDPDTADKVARQIRRIVDVHEVLLCRDEELIAREVAMFKVTRTPALDAALAKLPVRILDQQETSVVAEQTGTEAEIQETLKQLAAFGVTEFVRSGRIGMRKDGINLSTVLNAADPRIESPAEDWI